MKYFALNKIIIQIGAVFQIAVLNRSTLNLRECKSCNGTWNSATAIDLLGCECLLVSSSQVLVEGTGESRRFVCFFFVGEEHAGCLCV